MLIVEAVNYTLHKGKRLMDVDGKSNYRVWVGVNQTPIWHGEVHGHVRSEGAAALLRRIADQMDKEGA